MDLINVASMSGFGIRIESKRFFLRKNFKAGFLKLLRAKNKMENTFDFIFSNAFDKNVS